MRKTRKDFNEVIKELNVRLFSLTKPFHCSKCAHIRATAFTLLFPNKRIRNFHCTHEAPDVLAAYQVCRDERILRELHLELCSLLAHALHACDHEPQLARK